MADVISIMNEKAINLLKNFDVTISPQRGGAGEPIYYKVMREPRVQRLTMRMRSVVVSTRNHMLITFHTHKIITISVRNEYLLNYRHLRVSRSVFHIHKTMLKPV